MWRESSSHVCWGSCHSAGSTPVSRPYVGLLLFDELALLTLLLLLILDAEGAAPPGGAVPFPGRFDMAQ